MQGPTGADGIQGLQGPTGADGIQGLQGVTGPVGPSGAAGPTGAVGVLYREVWVSTTTYDTNDVVTHNGSTWISTADNILGEEPGNPLSDVFGDWQLLAAKGADGATGVAGPTGAVGASGAVGAAGPTGAVGPTGATGTAGAPGAPGAAGVTGPTGAAGAAGATGATGAAGAAGAAGPTGPSAQNGVNPQTGAGYTVVSGDNGKLITVSNAANQTITLPSAVPANGWYIDVQNIGAGLWTFNGGGHNIDGAAANLTLDTNQGVRIFSDGSNYLSQRGAAPQVYSTAGALQPGAHVIVGRTSATTGGVTVTLTGSAIFTSNTSYHCTASAVGTRVEQRSPVHLRLHERFGVRDPVDRHDQCSLHLRG